MVIDYTLTKSYRYLLGEIADGKVVCVRHEITTLISNCICLQLIHDESAVALIIGKKFGNKN